MIDYKIPITQPNNLSKIISLIEQKYSILMHESEILPTISMALNGFVGITTSIYNYSQSSLNHQFVESILHIIFFDSVSYSKRDNNGNIIYLATPLSVIPPQSEIETLIKGLI